MHRRAVLIMRQCSAEHRRAKVRATNSNINDSRYITVAHLIGKIHKPRKIFALTIGRCAQRHVRDGPILAEIDMLTIE